MWLRSLGWLGPGRARGRSKIRCIRRYERGFQVDVRRVVPAPTRRVGLRALLECAQEGVALGRVVVESRRLERPASWYLNLSSLDLLTVENLDLRTSASGEELVEAGGVGPPREDAAGGSSGGGGDDDP